MLQVFYTQAQRGPAKVIKNLLSGLSNISASYVNLGGAENMKRCIGGSAVRVPDSEEMICLNNHPILNSHFIEKLVIGPNICTLPIDLPAVMEQKWKKLIAPSDWTKDLYAKYIDKEKIEVWPVGIDTQLFPEVIHGSGSFSPLFDCLIYFKRRNHRDLDYVKSLLDSLNQKWTVIEYGNYSEEEFKKTLKNSRYCFSLNSTESQGIATQEIMSSNLPIFAWDVDAWTDRGEEHECSASSVPYWSDTCGEKECNKKEISEKFNFFIKNLNSYSPRKFILDNLSLEKQAQELLDIVNK